MAQRQHAPEPATEPAESTHSGRLLLRMPPSLHAELARTAESEGVSLNAFISAALSGAVGWRTPGERIASAPRPNRLLRAALILDVLLVAIAAALAIALLIVAWP
jgi:hypothetical protein